MADAVGFQGLSIITDKWTKPPEGWQGVSLILGNWVPPATGWQGLSIVTEWNGNSVGVKRRYKVKK